MAKKVDYKKEISSAKLENIFNDINEKIGQLRLSKGFGQFILYCVAELFSNIKEHSRATKTLITIKTNKDCLIKIADNGIGLKKSYLSKNIYPKDDSSAIEFALSGLSTKRQKERGYGLYSIKELIEEMNGIMKIKTGNTLAIIKKNKIEFKKGLKKEIGTAISLQAKIKKIDIYKILK